LRLKPSKKIVTSSLPISIELVASLFIFISIGYFIGSAINNFFSVLGMFIGATIGFCIFLYRIINRFQ